MTIRSHAMREDDAVPTNTERPTPDMLKRAFSLFPSGVVIATTLDVDGDPHGFTASTFVPLSVDPPMVLMCLNRTAQCFEAFMTSQRFAVSVLRPGHEEVAMRFATRGADKFKDVVFDRTDDGLPVIEGALATFECRTSGRHPGGDHVILTGVVEGLCFEDEGAAMVHFVRSFRELQI